MNNMTLMDLQAAVIAHLNWKSRLTDFFYGIENLTAADVPDHTRCDFGKWLYDRGLKELAGLSETSQMELLHKEVHDDIRAVVAMSKEQREGEDGKARLAKFKDKCDQFVEMLERMEKQVK
ncbi:CZB domain-containing protein [Desulfobulbus sp. F4]|nr:CZB domain-containing protein [Desulfobulbus sp. F4]